MLNTSIFATAITCMTIATETAAIAQEATAPSKISSPDLEPFVLDYKEIAAIDQEYGVIIQEAGNKQAIISEVQAAMTQAALLN